jgi:hypothetical protein
MPLASDCFVGAKITGGGDFANGFLPVPSSPCHQPVFELFRGGDEKASAASFFSKSVFAFRALLFISAAHRPGHSPARPAGE